MKSKITRNMAGLLVVAALAVMISGMFLYRNVSLRNQFKQEKIRSEALLSGKLDFEKSMEKFKKDLTQMKGRYAKLDQALKETQQQLALKESEMKRLRMDKTSLVDLKKQNAELEALRGKLEVEIAGLNKSMNQLIDENIVVSEQLAFMNTKNESLALQNAMMQAMFSDNYRIEALRGKHDKLTVSARKTDTMIASFDLPTGFGGDLYFKVLSPDNKEFSSVDNEAASIIFYDGDDNLMASLTGGSIPAESKSKIRTELIYKPGKKLTRGTYSFNVYDGKDYISCLQLRLK